MIPRELRWEDPLAQEHHLLHLSVEQLTQLLGERWTVDPLGRKDDRLDAVWRLVPPERGSPVTVVVEVKATGLAPHGVERAASQLARARQFADDPRATGLLVAPYLSPRTRHLLNDLGVNYIDATGNVLLRLAKHSVLIRSDGAQNDPTPRPGPRRGLSGLRVGRLVRDLVDYKPPRRGHELAASTGLSESYVSRVLGLLGDESLLHRERRVVTEVDWVGLLRARASSYDLISANHVVPATSRCGREATLDRLRQQQTTLPEQPEPILATGTFAANAFARTVSGAPLLLYIPTASTAATEACETLGLLPVEQYADADVLLLQPIPRGVFDRPHPDRVEGVRIPGLSQVVLDCLNGPGRLSAAGEELIIWMRDHEDRWRAGSPLARRS